MKDKEKRGKKRRRRTKEKKDEEKWGKKRKRRKRDKGEK